MHHCNKSELAGIFGVTIPTIDQWVRDGMPVADRPNQKGAEWTFETSQAIYWKIGKAIEDKRRRRSGAAEGVAPDGDPIKLAQVRKLIAEAEIKEQKAALAKREVVRVDDAAMVLSAAIGNAKGKLLGLGSKVAPLVAMESEEGACRDIIDAEVREALEELADVSLDVAFEDVEQIEEDDAGEGSEN